MDAKDGTVRDFRQWRRLRAFDLKDRGWRRRDVAEALDVSEVSVGHWLALARTGGPRALLSHPIPGRPPALSAAQRQMIPELLWHGAEAYGFRGSLWTCARVARVIEEEFGVAYDKGHVSRLLKQLRWTPQMPIRRASQRDEPAISHWREQRWPQLLEQARNHRS
jgi:transposase